MKTAEEILNEKGKELISIDPEATIFKAIQTMAKHNIGSILVKKKNKIVGIWTERDLLHNSISPNFNPHTAKISDFMSTNLQSASYDETPYQLKDKFLGKRIRRILIQKKGKYIGILSIGDVVRACLIEKDVELKELNTMIKWDYYENWRWDRKKGKI
jgi:signal-transduction protein with cAMP-binding, CBS, and nucleotidyltransferase domain